MTTMPERQYDEASGKIAIVVSEFNRDVCEGLLDGAQKVFDDIAGVSYEVFWAPGAFEIPLMCQVLAEKKEYQAIVALGAVLKGETYHFELVANECARGCMDVMLKTKTPVVFEVLAAYTYEDALRRSQGIHNHGRVAAYVALEWLQRKRELNF